MTKDIKQRFETALNSETPSDDLIKLALDLRNEGVTQIDLYQLYSSYQQIIDGGDSRYETFFDIMDLIWGGGWAKGHALYDHELTEEEIGKKNG
jgi:hypothetical protein